MSDRLLFQWNKILAFATITLVQKHHKIPCIQTIIYIYTSMSEIKLKIKTYFPKSAKWDTHEDDIVAFPKNGSKF